MEALPVFKDFKVNSLHKEYKVQFASYKKEMSKLILPGDFIILDKNISHLYPDILDFSKQFKCHLISPSEDEKAYENIGIIINIIVESGFSKNNRLIAIGGGVTQDITSFIASIL